MAEQSSPHLWRSVRQHTLLQHLGNAFLGLARKQLLGLLHGLLLLLHLQNKDVIEREQSAGDPEMQERERPKTRLCFLVGKWNPWGQVSGCCQVFHLQHNASDCTAPCKRQRRSQQIPHLEYSYPDLFETRVDVVVRLVTHGGRTAHKRFVRGAKNNNKNNQKKQRISLHFADCKSCMPETHSEATMISQF